MCYKLMSLTYLYSGAIIGVYKTKPLGFSTDLSFIVIQVIG